MHKLNICLHVVPPGLRTSSSETIPPLLLLPLLLLLRPWFRMSTSSLGPPYTSAAFLWSSRRCLPTLLLLLKLLSKTWLLPLLSVV